tara:strand:+ start:560 stop:793 length:234 start_codon:yes stop_codon:yes gene_type:complete
MEVVYLIAYQKGSSFRLLTKNPDVIHPDYDVDLCQEFDTQLSAQVALKDYMDNLSYMYYIPSSTDYNFTIIEVYKRD